MAVEAGGERTPAAFVEGLQSGLLVAAGIAAVGAFVAFSLVRPHDGAGRARHEAAAEPVA